ncbi:Tf2-8, partial [Mucuna pruriens]
MCIDSQTINKIIVKYRYPIPSLDDMLDELYGSCVFTKIDLKSGYNQIRKQEDEHVEHLHVVLNVLRENKLYGNLKMFSFCLEYVVFKGFVVSSKGISVDKEMVRQLENDLYLRMQMRRFVKNFSSIIAPLNELVKKNVVFKWDDMHEKAFNLLKDKLTNAPLLCLPNFDKAFEIECDASSVGIRAILMQESKPIAYFSEKL